MADEYQIGFEGVETLLNEESDAQISYNLAEILLSAQNDLTLAEIGFNGFEFLNSAQNDLTLVQLGLVAAEVTRGLRMGVTGISLLDGAESIIYAPSVRYLGTKVVLVDGAAPQIFAPSVLIPPLQVTAPDRERNPYAAHLPETQEDTDNYLREQQKVLREQHNKTQAGDSTFDFGLLFKNYPTQEYTLGSLGRFYHDDYGLILARFCKLKSFLVDDHQGVPVGRLINNKSEVTDWTVTSDIGKTSRYLAMGFTFFNQKPDDDTYGWVVVNGANPATIYRAGTEILAPDTEVTWHDDYRVVKEGAGKVLGRVWGYVKDGSLAPGQLFINLESWSKTDLAAFVLQTSAGIIDDVAELDERLMAAEGQITTNVVNIAANSTSILDLSTRLTREEQIRARQISALQTLTNQFPDYQGDIDNVYVTLRAEIQSGDNANYILITQNTAAIADIQATLTALDIAGLTTDVDNLVTAVVGISSRVDILYSSTAIGQMLISHQSGTDEAGNPIYEFQIVDHKLDSLIDVDLTTPPTTNQSLLWNGVDNFVAGTVVLPSRQVIAGTGLSGGGDLSADRTLNLANTAVTPGSYTNANITVDAQGRLTAAANGTGGGGGSGGYPDLTPPVDTDFTITLNAPTVTDSGNGIFLESGTDASLLRGRLKSLPGGNFTVIARVTGAFSVDFNQAGIVFRDTAGKYVIAGPINVSGTWFEHGQWSDQTTWNSAAGAYDLDTANFPEWIKCVFDSTTNDITSYFSWDGLNWKSIGTSTYLGTADAFGIACGQRSTSRGVLAAFSSWAVS